MYSRRPASGPTPSPIGRLEDDTAEPLDDPHAALRLPHQDAPASPAHEHELADLSSAPFDVPTPAPNHALSLYSGRSGHGSSRYPRHWFLNMLGLFLKMSI